MSSRMLSGILAFLWFWSGAIFVTMFLSELNKSTRYFIGILFVIQGILLLVCSKTRHSSIIPD